MTAAEVLALHAAIEERRRELGMLRWQVAVEIDITQAMLGQMRQGVASARTRQAAEAWLHRHTSTDPAPPSDH